LWAVYSSLIAISAKWQAEIHSALLPGVSGLAWWQKSKTLIFIQKSSFQACKSAGSTERKIMSESQDGSASSSASKNSKRGAPRQEIWEHYTLTDRIAATNRYTAACRRLGPPKYFNYSGNFCFHLFGHLELVVKSLVWFGALQNSASGLKVAEFLPWSVKNMVLKKKKKKLHHSSHIRLIRHLTTLINDENTDCGVS
jgi:hypothetical protein